MGIHTFDGAISGAARAVPRPNGDADHDRPEAQHVVPVVAPVAQEYLVGILAGPAFTADDPAVVVALGHGVLGRPHDVLHRPELPVRRRRRRAAAGRENLPRRRRRAGQRCHWGRRGAEREFSGLAEG